MLAFAMFMSVCGAVIVMPSAYVVSCTYPPVEPEEWGLLSLDQAETFNWVESIIPILKDKATSPRGEFVGDYFAYMGGLVSPFKELSQKERNSVTNSTRLLLAYLLRYDLKKDLQEFFTNTQRTLILRQTFSPPKIDHVCSSLLLTYSEFLTGISQINVF